MRQTPVFSLRDLIWNLLLFSWSLSQMKKLTPREWWWSIQDLLTQSPLPSPPAPQLLFALPQGVKKRTLNEPKLKLDMKGGKKTTANTSEQRKLSASRNSLNQSHMWTQTQWPFRQFSTNITGFSRHIDFFSCAYYQYQSFFFFKILGMIADLLTRQAGCQKPEVFESKEK